MNLDSFIGEVLGAFADGITDQVFLMIQNDRNLMQKYLNLVKSGTDPHMFNCKLGNQIKAKFSLENGGRCTNPKSTLICSYERHKIK